MFHLCDGDPRRSIIEGHIHPRNVPPTGKDPGQDRADLGFIPGGDDACGEIHVDFFGIARGSRPEFADAVTALVGEPAGGIATKARRRLEPLPTDDGTHLVNRRLRDGEGEPIEGCGKDVVIHERSFHSSAIQAPVLPNGGVFAVRAVGWRRQARAA